MTVKQLKEQLSTLPEDVDVFIYSDDGEFQYQPLESVKQTMGKFHEGVEGGAVAYVDIVILYHQ